MPDARFVCNIQPEYLDTVVCCQVLAFFRTTHGGNNMPALFSIAEYLGVVQSAITPLADRLEAQGIVQRVRSQEDRRVWLVALTERGLALYADQENVYQAVAAEMLAPLDEAEQKTLISLMGRIGATVEEA